MLRKIGTLAVMLVISAVSGTFGAVCSADDRTDFGYHADSSGLSVYIKDYDPSQQYSISLNGGKGFIPVYGKSGVHFTSLPEGTYQLCAMVTGKRSTLSDTKAVCLGDSGINHDKEILINVTGISEEHYKGGSISIDIENYSPSEEYMISVNGGKNWLKADGKTTVKSGFIAGNYTVAVKSRNDSSKISRNVEITVPVKNYAPAGHVRAPMIKQLPELPTGCEVTSLAMALNFYDLNIKHTSLADSFLEKGAYRESDYRKVFVGDPRVYRSYGCYAEVIVNTAEKFLKTVPDRSFKVYDLTGCEPDRLYSYIDMGYPVIVRATSKRMPTTKRATWTDRSTGKTIKWIGNEHCLLLTGYDTENNLVFVNDPQAGTGTYKLDLFEERFFDLGKQAVVIIETT